MSLQLCFLKGLSLPILLFVIFLLIAARIIFNHTSIIRVQYLTCCASLSTPLAPLKSKLVRTPTCLVPVSVSVSQHYQHHQLRSNIAISFKCSISCQFNSKNEDNLSLLWRRSPYRDLQDRCRSHFRLQRHTHPLSHRYPQQHQLQRLT